MRLSYGRLRLQYLECEGAPAFRRCPIPGKGCAVQTDDKGSYFSELEHCSQAVVRPQPGFLAAVFGQAGGVQPSVKSGFSCPG